MHRVQPPVREGLRDRAPQEYPQSRRTAKIVSLRRSQIHGSGVKSGDRAAWGEPRSAAMVRPRISIAGMMILLVVLGLALTSLRFPSEGAAAVVLLVTQAILAVAVLAVVYSTQERRAFWLGFALFGWGYMALSRTGLRC